VIFLLKEKICSEEGICLGCGKPLRGTTEKWCRESCKEWSLSLETDDEWSKRGKRYEKYMKIPLLRYWPDDRTLGKKYWDFIFNHAPKEMYDLLSKGRSLDEIAEEFDRKAADVKKMIREHAEKNNLENPYPLKPRKPRQRKPNGLFCLACNRPLFGRQRKWCDNDDCGGWNDLHPRIVRQCSVCKNITETYAGSGYETVCQGCSNFPEDAKQRTAKWIANEKESAEFIKERRAEAHDGRVLDISTECDDDVFFGYLKIDFGRRIITPIGKNAEDMFDICRDIQRAWELCKPMWPSFVLEDGTMFDKKPMSCPVYSPSLRGPNGISCLLAPLEDWEITVDIYHWWFDMNGENVTYLSMGFSDWLQRQYVESGKDIEEIASVANTTIYRIEFALNELSIPLRKDK
jgi:hypothetical protein